MRGLLELVRYYRAILPQLSAVRAEDEFLLKVLVHPFAFDLPFPVFAVAKLVAIKL